MRRSHMRIAVGLLWCTCLAAADLAHLRELAQRKRLFELRRLLEQPGSNGTDTLYYRAMVAGRFGHELLAIEQFHEFLATDPPPESKRKAHEEMAAALTRVGRYGEAAQELADALLLTPKEDDQRSDNENERALRYALREVPPQTIEFGAEIQMKATRNRLGSWNVPVELNGDQGEWIFDTGANFSVLSESEAKKIGLSVREASAYVGGSTLQKNALRLAVASNLTFGSAHLHNVVFLVIADQALFVGPLKYQIHGILGLPVLRALGQVGISAQGEIKVGGTEQEGEVAPNLFFDELSPIVEAVHGSHHLQFFLDTGANTGSLYPVVRELLREDELAKVKTKKETMAGVGKIVKTRSQFLPVFHLEVSSLPVELQKVTLLSQTPPGNLRYRDGVLGMDALARGFVLDFQKMQLRLK